MVTQQLKHDFINLFGDMVHYGLSKEDIIAMGNVAYFFDRCLAKPGCLVLKQHIAMQMTSPDKLSRQELFLLLANNIYEHAKKEKRGENLDYRMERVIEKHAKKALTHFEILLDDYDFPDWFKLYIPFIEANEPQKVCQLLIEIIHKKPSFKGLLIPHDYAEKIDLYVHRAYHNTFKWKKILPLVDALLDEDFDKTISLLDIRIGIV